MFTLHTRVFDDFKLWVNSSTANRRVFEGKFLK